MQPWFLKYPICHRGAHWFEGVDENSFEAFERAIAMGLPFEIDVHLSLDGEVFIHHDKSFQRLGGQNINLTNRTSSQLIELRTRNSAHGIVLLRDLLKLVKGQVPLVIEIKHTRRDNALEDRLIETLKGYSGEYSLQCFYPFSITYLKKQGLSCPLGLLGGPLKDEPIAYPFKVFVKSLCMAPKLKPDYIAYQWDCLAKRAPQRMREDFEIPLIGWTVTDELSKSFCERYSDNYIFENLSH